ncbi:hypothetical protein OBBRIDRAFT_798651 [Obba rivulosa]|uniref:MACPF domain-containing protein n=1 Tax=Obba rivulosa TaxID=1052685 RepID=A0A8E2AI59_9APHY|nr:hypothetical protein OBBRIDRAFT_798651 [Obba rivulosa]
MDRRWIPTESLGYGLDLTTVTAQDIKGVLTSVKTNYRVLDFSADSRTIQLCGKIWRTPNNVAMSIDHAGTSSSFTAYTNGTSLRMTMAADSDFMARYSAFSSGVSCSYSVCKSFRDDCHYVLYNMNNVRYTVDLQKESYLLNEQYAARIKKLPSNFKPNHLQQFKDFFGVAGSHIVTNATYGSRFNLVCWISNTSMGTSDHLPEDDTALKGITSGEDLMTYIQRVKTTRFTDDRHKCRLNQSVFCTGGDHRRRGELNFNPYIYNNFDAWAASTSTHPDPDLISVGMEAIWTIADTSSDRDVRSRAQALHDAFDYITSHPAVCRTQARLTINSDWAEFTLSTPGAMLVVTGITGDQPRSVMSNWNRIAWGLDRSVFGEVEIQFDIYYDGSPIDFHTGHGSSGIKGDGQIVVTVEGNQYRNIGIVDNKWNIRHYSQVPTSKMADSQLPVEIAENMGHLVTKK